jgi:hypothetical protein
MKGQKKYETATISRFSLALLAARDADPVVNDLVDALIE